MPIRDFFEDRAKTTVRAAVERVESQTSAELVVAVRRTAGRYRDADMIFGAAVALACLLVILFSERVYATAWIPFDVVVAFLAAALFSWRTPTVRRLFVGGARRAESVRRAACTSFHELGIARTKGRNGIFVLVGAFERKVAVVYDLGIDPRAVGPAFTDAIRRIEASVDRASPDLDAFVAALESLGPALAPTMPRGEDDTNELPDDLGVA